MFIEEKLNACRLRQVERCGIAPEIGGGIDQPGQSLLIGQARLMRVRQSGCDSR